jgi:hypothetical protein
MRIHHTTQALSSQINSRILIIENKKIGKKIHLTPGKFWAFIMTFLHDFTFQDGKFRKNKCQGHGPHTHSSQL